MLQSVSVCSTSKLTVLRVSMCALRPVSLRSVSLGWYSGSRVTSLTSALKCSTRLS